MPRIHFVIFVEKVAKHPRFLEIAPEFQKSTPIRVVEGVWPIRMPRSADSTVSRVATREGEKAPPRFLKSRAE